MSTGCAECRGAEDECLIETKGPFETVAAAQAESWIARAHPARGWAEHPQGGVWMRDGQGDDWVMPL